MNRLPLNEKINPDETALLVIDIQIDFCSPEGLLAKRGRDLSLMEPMIGKLQNLIQYAEKHKVLTAYTQQIYDRTKLTDLQKEQYDLDGKLITCDINTEGYKFYKIDPPKDNIFVKHNFNAFSNQKLLETLQKNNSKTLIITGVDTQYCVETAIRNGFDLGYKIVVPEDLIATNANKLDMHNRTLELVRKVYGVVVTSADILSAWEK